MSSVVEIQTKYTADASKFETETHKVINGIDQVTKTGIAATIGLTALGEVLQQLGQKGAEAIKGAVEASVDWERLTTELQNNTGSTVQVLNEMKQGILDVAHDSNVAFDDLATGMEKVRDHGFDAAGSQEILNSAMKAASSTGSDTAQVANLVAQTLHQYHESADNAATVTDILMLSAQKTNATFEEFASKASIVTGLAANLGIPLDQVAAGLSALERNGFTAAEAQTQLKNVFTHLIKPAKEVQDRLASLSKQTGIDLVKDFERFGSKGYDLTKVLGDLQKAFIKLGYDQQGATSETMKLLNAQRGGLGMAVLAGIGYKDYNSILGQYADIIEGKVSPSQEAYNNSIKTVAYQVGIMQNRIQEAAIAFGDVFKPVILEVVMAINGLLDSFNKMDPQTRSTIAVITAVATAMFAMIGPLLIGVAMLPLLSAGFSMLAGPLGLVALGIFGVGTALAVFGAAFFTNFQNTRVIVTAWWENTLRPVLMQLEDWFISKIPAAVKLGTDVWNNIAMPVFKAVADVIINNLLPAFGHVVDWAQIVLPRALSIVSTLINTLLIPAFKLGADFLTGIFLPAIMGIGSIFLTVAAQVTPIIVGIGRFILDIFGQVVHFIEGIMRPAFQSMSDFVVHHTQLIQLAFGGLVVYMLGYVVSGVLTVASTILEKLVPALIALVAEIDLSVIPGFIKMAVMMGVDMVVAAGYLFRALIEATAGIISMSRELMGTALLSLGAFINRIRLLALTLTTEAGAAIAKTIIAIAGMATAMIAGGVPALIAITAATAAWAAATVAGMSQILLIVGGVIAVIVILETIIRSVMPSWGEAFDRGLTLVRTKVEGIFSWLYNTVTGQGQQAGFDGGKYFVTGMDEAFRQGSPFIQADIKNVADIINSLNSTGFTAQAGYWAAHNFGEAQVQQLNQEKIRIADQIRDIASLYNIAGFARNARYDIDPATGKPVIVNSATGLTMDQQKADLDKQMAEINRWIDIYSTREGEKSDYGRGIGNFKPYEPTFTNPFAEGNNGSPFGDGKGGGGSGKNQKDAITAAADMAKAVSDAVIKGVEALAKLGNLHVPTNIAEKAHEFSVAVDAIMMELQKVALKYAYEVKTSKDNSILATQAIENYAGAAGKALNMFDTAFDFFSKLVKSGDKVLHSNVLLVNLTNEIALKVKVIMNTFGPMTAGWDEIADNQVGKYAEAVQKVFQGLTAAWDFFEKIYIKGDRVLHSHVALASIAVQIMEKSNIIVNNFAAYASQWTNPDWTKTVSDYAQAVQAAFGALSAGWEFFDKIYKDGDKVLHSHVALASIAAEISQKSNIILNNFSTYAKSWVDPEWTTSVDNYSKAVIASYSALSAGWEFFNKIWHDAEQVMHGHVALASIASEISTKSNIILNDFSKYAQGWLDPEWTTTVDNYSKAVVSTYQALSAGWDFFEKIYQKAQEVLNPHTALESYAATISNSSALITGWFKDYAKDWTDPDLVQQMDNASKATQSTFTALSSAWDFFEKIADNAAQIMPKMTTLEGYAKDLAPTVENIAFAFGQAFEKWNNKDWTDQIVRVAQTAGEVMKALQDTYGFLSALVDSDKVLGPKANPLQNFDTLMTDLKTVLNRWSTEVPNLKDLAVQINIDVAKAVGEIAGGLNNTLQLFEGLFKFRSVPEFKITALFENIKMILLKIPVLTAAISEDARKAAQDMGTKLAPAFALLKDALDIFKMITGEIDEKGNKKGGLLNVDPAAIGELTGKMWLLITTFKRDLLDKIAPEIQDLAQAFAAKVGPAISVLHDALDLFIKLVPDSEGKGGLKQIDPDAIGALVGNLYTLLHHWRNLIIGGEFQGDFATRSEQFVQTVRTVTELINEVLDLSNGVADRADKAGGDSAGAFGNIAAALTGFLDGVNQALGKFFNPTDTSQLMGMWKEAFGEEGKAGNPKNIWYIWNHAFDGMFSHLHDAWMPQLIELVLKPFFTYLGNKFGSFSAMVVIWEADWDAAATAVEQSVERMITALNKLPDNPLHTGGTTTTTGGDTYFNPPSGKVQTHSTTNIYHGAVIVNGKLEATVPEANHRTMASIRITKNLQTPGSLPTGL